MMPDRKDLSCPTGAKEQESHRDVTQTVYTQPREKIDSGRLKTLWMDYEFSGPLTTTSSNLLESEMGQNVFD